MSVRGACLVGVLAVMTAVMGGVHVSAAQTPAQGTATSPVYVDPVRGRSVEELVALALERSPEIQAARLRVDLAQGDRDQAGGRPNPAVSFERRDQIHGADHQTSIGFMMPLDLFARSGRVTVATHDVETASAAADDRARIVALTVRLLAARLLAAVHHLEVEEAMAAASGQTATLIAARAEAGTSPTLDRDAARLDARMAELQVRRERAETASAAAALRSAVGLAPGEPLLLRESLEDLVHALQKAPPASLEIDAAVAARPDLRQADAAIARQVARQDLWQREARPEVALSASYMHMASSFPQFGLTMSGSPTPIAGTFDTISIGATVSLPWGQRNQGAIAAAGFARQAAERDREALKIRALNDIDALRAREAEARAALALFDDDMRALATHNVEVVRESYQLGRATLLDVLAETRRYLDVQTAYAFALLEVVESRVQLAAALGER